MLAFVMVTSVVTAMPAQAELTQQEKNSRFLGLIRNFTDNTERKLDLIDRDPSIPVVDLEKRLVFDRLPNGQTLLLRPKIGRFIYEYNIYALKENDRLYFSLLDVIDVLDLAIDFNEDTKIGQGWFLREDWDISLDLKNGQVISKGESYSVDLKNVVEDKGTVFVTEEDISHWFGMDFSVNVSEQYLEIDSPYPLPNVAQAERRKNRRSVGRSQNNAVLPRLKTEYSMFDVNAADVRLGTRRRSKTGEKTSNRHTATVAVDGQALKHEAYAVASYDDLFGLNSVVARLSKRDEDPVLLGPLRARSYSIGDTETADLPLTGNSRQEFGFHVSNNELVQNSFQTTEINGDALPGWDVELYRNGILNGTETVDESGRYEFANVQLYRGDNLFELYFYGPQGEIRTRDLNVPVTAELLKTQDNTYDVSLSMTDSRTYRKGQLDDVDENTPHLAARFNKVIGETLTYIGARNRDVEGKNKTFLGAGFTHLFDNTILDGNFGVDEQASAAAQLTARRSFNKWDTAVGALVQDDEYAPNETLNPKTLSLTGSTQRSFYPRHSERANVSLRGEYSDYADGQNLMAGDWGTSYQVGNLNFSNSLLMESFSGSKNQSEDRLLDILSMRATLGEYFLRGGVSYNLSPESQVDKYFSQISYRPRPEFSSDLTLDHDPDRSFTEARLNLNYTHDKFRASPFVEIDSDHEIFAGVNVNFNVVDRPREIVPDITSKRVIGRGMVSSFVYHDKNGNNTFDGDDEPLPEVIVESVNIRRRVETNEKGYSLINDLPPTRATDIHVDVDTLPDSFMVAGHDGVSIFPSPGEVVELEFPVHLSGEIDGTVSIRKENGELETARGAKVMLYPLDHGKDKVIKTDAAFDGFYVASRIPPGRYLMALSDETAKDNKAAAPPPKFINIGYGGDVIYGYNFEMAQDVPNVGVTVTYVNPAEISGMASGDIIYSLKAAPQGQSRLSAMLGKLARSYASSDLFDGLQEISWVNEKGEAQKRYVAGSNTLEAAYDKCSNMVWSAVPCSLEILVPVVDQPLIRTASR